MVTSEQDHDVVGGTRSRSLTCFFRSYDRACYIDGDISMIVVQVETREWIIGRYECTTSGCLVSIKRRYDFQRKGSPLYRTTLGSPTSFLTLVNNSVTVSGCDKST